MHRVEIDEMLKRGKVADATMDRAMLHELLSELRRRFLIMLLTMCSRSPTSTGTLSRDEVRALLIDLNGGLKVSWREVDWTIDSADVDHDGVFSRKELRAAVAALYMHIPTTQLLPTTGFRALLPWLFSGTMACLAALIVAYVSARWSREVTSAWLNCTVLSLFWKLIILDPLKLLCCGSFLEPLVAVIWTWQLIWTRSLS